MFKPEPRKPVYWKFKMVLQCFKTSFERFKTVENLFEFWSGDNSCVNRRFLTQWLFSKWFDLAFFYQGVWNRREIQLTARPIIWLYMVCRRYFIWRRNIRLMYNYRVYNNLFWIFLRDKKVTETNYQLKYAIFSTTCSIMYKYCTRPISKHLYSGIFKNPLDTKHEIFKKRRNS